MDSRQLFDLSGRVAIVTGGNGGLGLGMARGLAGAGADIVVAARDAEKISGAVAELEGLGARALGVTVDVTQEAEIKNMVTQTVEAFGREWTSWSTTPARWCGKRRTRRPPRNGTWCWT